MSTTFIFDNIKSSDMGLYNIRLDSGGTSSPYISRQDIIEDEIINSHKPLLYGTRKRPIEFTLIFSTLEEEFNSKKRLEIARWLIHDEYKAFQTTDYLGKIFNVIAISDVEFIEFGSNKGYFEVTFRCDAPWAWSPTYVEYYDLSNNSSKTIITMENNSNVLRYYYPEIEFKLEGSSIGVTLKNLSDGGREFKFTGLKQGETIYVDNERNTIITDEINTYRISDFNKNWLRLVYGKNQIEVTGQCRIQTRMKYPLYV